MKYKFCYKCGSKAEIILVEGRKQAYCPECQTILYDNPIRSVAVCTRNNDNQILLVKRAVEPEKGKWCLPGGFVERGETTRETALRELKEETGLAATSPQLLGVETHLNGYFGDILLIGYSVVLENYKPVAGDDAAKAHFFDLSSMPEIAFRAHRIFIEHYQKNIEFNETRN